MRNFMSWIKGGIIVIIVTTTAIKFADLAFGYLAPDISLAIENRGIYRNIILKEINPNYSALLEPGPQDLLHTDSLDQKKYKIRTDENGFIQNGNNIVKNAVNARTIIYFGGSTTQQVFVSEKFRWQSILERNLNSSDKNTIYEILNAGVYGNHSMHSTLNLLAKGIEISPDYAVLMHNIND